MLVKIKSIKKLDAKYDRYDLTVPETNNFYANGILVHNTSCRIGYMKIVKKKWYDGILSSLGLQKKTKYAYCVGSRRVTKYISKQKWKQSSNFYSEDLWTHNSLKYFEDKLRPDEQIFFEIVGYLTSGQSIMPKCSNEKLKKHFDKKEYKEFIARYGAETDFNYGASPTTCKIFVYRITQNGRDLTWDQVKLRCEELNIKHVPEIDRFLITEEHKQSKYWEDRYENYHCEHFPHHIREGVVLRVENNQPTPMFLKYKNFVFKVLENIIKDTTDNIEEEN